VAVRRLIVDRVKYFMTFLSSLTFMFVYCTCMYVVTVKVFASVV
jgi:hypothetical protein